MEGGNGIFDVFYGEDLVFSKDAEKRFPETSEILKILRSATSSG